MKNIFLIPKSILLLVATAMLAFTSCAATSASTSTEGERTAAAVSPSGAITLEVTELPESQRDLRMMRGLLDSFIHESTGRNDFSSEGFLLPGKGLLFGEFASGRFFISRAEMEFFNSDGESDPDVLNEQIREGARIFLQDYVRTGGLDSGDRIILLFPHPSAETDYLIGSQRSGQRTSLLHRAVSGEYLHISAAIRDIESLRSGRLSASAFENRLTDITIRSNDTDSYRRMNEVIARGLESDSENPFRFTQASSLYLPGTGLILSGELRKDRIGALSGRATTIRINGMEVSPENISGINVAYLGRDSDSAQVEIVRRSEEARQRSGRADSLRAQNILMADSLRAHAEMELREIRESLTPALTNLREGLVAFRDEAVPALREMVAEIEAQADSLSKRQSRVSGFSIVQNLRTGRGTEAVYWPDREADIPDEATRETVRHLETELTGLIADFAHTLRQLEDDEIVLLNFTLRGGATGAHWRDTPLKLLLRVSDLRAHLSGSIDRDELNNRLIRL